MVDRELVELEKTLRNIEEARPFEDLTVVRILKRLGQCLRLGKGGKANWVVRL